MKRILSFLFSVMMVVSFAGCGNSNTENPGASDSSSQTEQSSTAVSESSADSQESGSSSSQETESDTTSDENDILIAYFSKTGNTETVANMIADVTGGELFQVETVTPYPEDYNETVEIAREEQDTDARPELAAHVENMEQYDTVFLGYPNWWGTMPQAMFTFLEEYDFSGKTIIPFCTHGGSAFGRSETDIAELAPQATMLEGFEVSGSSADSAQEDVEEWIAGLGILE